MSDVPDVTLYGASGHSCAIALHIGSPASNPRLCNVVAFLDDFKGGSGLLLEGRPIVSWDEWTRDYLRLPCLVPIGDGVERRRLVEKVAGAGGSFPQLYEGHRMRQLGLSVGIGTILCSPGYVGPNTVIGEHVQIMPMHSIGHDVSISRFATLGPSVTISGHVAIGEAAFIGAGATVLNGRPDRPLSIGAGAVVAAGAVVTKPVSAGTTVMGNPARSLRQLALFRKRNARA